MKLTKEDVKDLVGQKILVIIGSNFKDFTYNCTLLSFGEDFIKIRDKYDTIRFLQLENIKVLEVLE